MLLDFYRKKFLTCAVGVGLLLISCWANADPPGRVARLGYTAGEISFSPAGQGDWVQAVVNRKRSTNPSKSSRRFAR
jgi:hypothetical protein